MVVVAQGGSAAPAADPDSNSGAFNVLPFLKSFGQAPFGKEGTDFAERTGDPLVVALGRVVNWLLGLLGVALTGLILYAGFLWFSAGGNEEQVTKARKILINAIVGLIVVLGAYAISYFIFYRLTLATLTTQTRLP